MNRSILHIQVLDLQRSPIARANVKVGGASNVQQTSPGNFVVYGLANKTIEVVVEAEGLETEQRQVSIRPGQNIELFILAEKGLPAYRKGNVRVPFRPSIEKLGITVRGKKETQALERWLLEQQISIEKEREPGLIVIQGEAAKNSELAYKLRSLAGVKAVGPVVHYSSEGVAFLSGNIILRTVPETNRDQVEAVARELGLTVRRKLALKDFWLLASEKTDLSLLEECDRLFASPLVVTAEPELAFTVETDDITPTDELVDEQWHIPHIRLPEAWQRLRDANPIGVTPGSAGDLTYGSANLAIAVIDEGVESQTDGSGNVTPTHPEFQGNVSNGQPKMLGFFDFGGMVANNDTPLGSHGTQCAGVATARAENSSTVAGEEEGVAGAAPNCRLLAVQVPSAGTETEFSDIYLWMAGLDPESDTPNFPPVLAQGADVITNSAGGYNPAIWPVSDLMDATFERLTDEGRGGRGTLLFFSAGNANSEFATQRPWANHPRTFGIAASNENDTKAGYSNFGDGIDLCAPSSDSAAGLRSIVTTDRPGQGDLAGHTGGGNDYTDGFGGTSSATPLTAGVAALLLSMDPTLTWSEVRDIFYNTAIKIDFSNTDSNGQWRDTNGDGIADYSNWYGFGRIDTAKAVCVARTLIQLDTPTVSFLDVPEEEPTLRAISFTVQSFRNFTFRVVDGPTTTLGPANSFVLHAGDTATHTGNWTCTASHPRIWVRYVGTNAGDIAQGVATVQCIETGEEFSITFTANTIERPRAAVVLALDSSGSMNDSAGDGRLKIEILRDSAVVVSALAQEDTGLGAVSWDTDADLANATPVGDAGFEVIGAGRAALSSHVGSHVTDPTGMTAIGDAVVAAQSLLNDASSDYAVKAMVVLTDGNETESLYLSELPAGAITNRVFAIGLGTPENIRPAALAQLTSNNDGYLLMTGNVTTDDYFLLTKYYQQILAGLTNTQIVVDPDGWLAPGAKLRLPFYVNETDWRVDAVLHTPFPEVIEYVLEAPDGQIIDPGALGGEPRSRYVIDGATAFYRLALPIAAIGNQDPTRPWHAVLTLNRKRWQRVLEKLEQRKEEYIRAVAHGLRYAFVVQARSTLAMQVNLVQSSLEPGALVTVTVTLTEYGYPAVRGAEVKAIVKRPDGASMSLEAVEGIDGVFEVQFNASMSGLYQVHVLASGTTRLQSPWTREALRSAVVWQGGDNPLPGPSAEDRFCRFLRCLQQSKGLDERRLRELGIDIGAVGKCICSKRRIQKG
ncbi:MAG TPA: S8 family serine peptidase [Leptolyngbyaceae cyanobacterium M33_DOE_097]|uniref:VWA domain-containing protein n=1 Tax=Oscillatoriales cyanobacterium SpSt-418 TaxID=2282169 RepID=A0A7C3PRJ7_9CYAN|nr:S8 family serine peptidase [Leptolyngbyaceae cyanobacterium M33_DOE_097]